MISIRNSKYGTAYSKSCKSVKRKSNSHDLFLPGILNTINNNLRENKHFSNEYFSNFLKSGIVMNTSIDWCYHAVDEYNFCIPNEESRIERKGCTIKIRLRWKWYYLYWEQKYTLLKSFFNTNIVFSNVIYIYRYIDI